MIARRLSKLSGASKTANILQLSSITELMSIAIAKNAEHYTGHIIQDFETEWVDSDSVLKINFDGSIINAININGTDVSWIAG